MLDNILGDIMFSMLFLFIDFKLLILMYSSYVICERLSDSIKENNFA
jgi:hypothetical protein